MDVGRIRCHLANSGFEGPWTFTPNLFNNQYFVLLKTLNWVADDRVKQLQYTSVSPFPISYTTYSIDFIKSAIHTYIDKPNGAIMMLPSDLLLRDDPGFKEYVGKNLV